MLGLFGRQDLSDLSEAKWLFDAFAWSLRYPGRDVFLNETRLVVPDNAHFPGRADSVAGMAGLVFDHVRRYAWMQHRPFRLENQATEALPVFMGFGLMFANGAFEAPVRACGWFPLSLSCWRLRQLI
jgi:hypothetical protein